MPAGLPARLTVHLIITGRVQGVGYRAWCMQTAEQLGLSGWVRNRRDGSVEAIAQGPDSAVQAFIAACHKGPAFAKVAGVAQRPVAAPGVLLPGFEQRPTV